MANYPTAPIVKNGDRIGFLGDSITNHGHELKCGYVNLVMQGLKDAGITAENVNAGMRVSILSMGPWPVPETLMIIICRRTAWHCLPFRDKITSSDCNCCDNECNFEKFPHCESSVCLHYNVTMRKK